MLNFMKNVSCNISWDRKVHNFIMTLQLVLYSIWAIDILSNSEMNTFFKNEDHQLFID